VLEPETVRGGDMIPDPVEVGRRVERPTRGPLYGRGG
jgi:hypothetical protein